jgi:hypothetical protein
MFCFAAKLLAFLLIVQTCTSQQDEQSSLLRCLTGYKDRYGKKKQILFFNDNNINFRFLFSVTVNSPTVLPIGYYLNVLAIVLKHAKIPT